jgi:hypothetical protein
MSSPQGIRGSFHERGNEKRPCSHTSRSIRINAPGRWKPGPPRFIRLMCTFLRGKVRVADNAHYRREEQWKSESLFAPDPLQKISQLLAGLG